MQPLQKTHTFKIIISMIHVGGSVRCKPQASSINESGSSFYPVDPNLRKTESSSLSLTKPNITKPSNLSGPAAVCHGVYVRISVSLRLPLSVFLPFFSFSLFSAISSFSLWTISDALSNFAQLRYN